MTKNVKVYYGSCGYHLVLLDPSAPRWEKAKPEPPVQTECRGCGEHFPVTLKQIREGLVYQDELDKGFALSEPDPAPPAPFCPHCLPLFPQLKMEVGFGKNRFRCTKCERLIDE